MGGLHSKERVGNSGGARERLATLPVGTDDGRLKTVMPAGD